MVTSAATQERSEFLERRRSGIGGSDISSLFNTGYGCTRRLFLDKRGVEPDYPFEETKAMRLGQILEPYFVDEYVEATQRTVSVLPMARHPEHEELLVHVDRMAYKPPVNLLSPGGVLEVKSVGRAAFYHYRREGLPIDYSLQLNHGMLVTGATWGSFAVGSRDSGDLLWWDVDPDKEIQERILEEGPKFWATVQNGPMPEALEPEDRRCQSCGYRLRCHGDSFIPVAEPSEYEQDDSLTPLVSEYVERRALKKEAEDLLEETKAELQFKLGERGKVMAGGARIQFYSIDKKGYTVAARKERQLRVYEGKK